MTRNQLLEISRRNEDTEFKVPLQQLSNVTAELQEGVMKRGCSRSAMPGRSCPPRAQACQGANCNKQIELEMHGAEATELDRQVLDLIKDPLTTWCAIPPIMVSRRRPSASPPASRRKGTIRLSAYHEGGHIIICIADNGRGLNTERIKAKAVQNGLVLRGRPPEDERGPDPQVHLRRQAYRPRPPVTSVSGRTASSMDVVRTNIDQIGGTIDIKSRPARVPPSPSRSR